MYYLLLARGIDRNKVLAHLKTAGVHAVFYVPLHSAPEGQHIGRSVGELPVTLDISSRLIRLPMWIGLKAEQQAHVVTALSDGI